MILNFKTERLPLNFIFLGIMLMGIGIMYIVNYKLFLYLPDKKILLMVGEKEFVFKAAEEISGALQTTINSII